VNAMKMNATAIAGGSLTFSLGWKFEQGAGFLAGLSLAVGVAVVRALEAEGADLALADKRRPRPDAVEIMNIIGDVKGKNAVLFDDVVTTASTLCQAAEAIKAAGGRDIYAGVTHGVLSASARERLAKAPIKELVVTDTVQHDSLPPHVTVLSVAKLLGEAVQRIHEERSLSSLFV